MFEEKVVVDQDLTVKNENEEADRHVQDRKVDDNHRMIVLDHDQRAQRLHQQDVGGNQFKHTNNTTTTTNSSSNSVHHDDRMGMY
jgi:hypothetical protein